MQLEKAVEILQEYIILDRTVRETSDSSSKFDSFCEEKCIAIETLIKFINKENKYKSK